eukprot:1729664-Rhodomonas_salina.2
MDGHKKGVVSLKVVYFPNPRSRFHFFDADDIEASQPTYDLHTLNRCWLRSSLLIVVCVQYKEKKDLLVSLDNRSVVYPTTASTIIFSLTRHLHIIITLCVPVSALVDARQA